MKEIILLIFIQVHTVSGGEIFGCMNPEVFKVNCKEQFSKEIQALTNKNHLLKVMKDIGEEIGKGSFGKVKAIEGIDQHLVMKIQHPETSVDIKDVQREIRMMKVACGLKPNEIIKTFIDCEGAEIAPFKGCVEDGKDVYIFQRRGYSSLEKGEMVKKYQSFEPIKRAVVMLKILDLVAGLHKKDIIHSDIKPENIVTRDSDLQELELIDLGLAGTNGRYFNGGSFGYLAPEMLSYSNLLSPYVDIYSLGITLLYFEKGFIEYTDGMDKSCFNSPIASKCHTELLGAIPSTLVQERGLNELTPVFTQAIAYYQRDRFTTVESFSRKIVEILMKNSYYKCFLSKVVIKEELKNNKQAQKAESSSLVYSWKTAVKEIIKATSSSDSLLKSVQLMKCEGDNNSGISIQSPQKQQQDSENNDGYYDFIGNEDDEFEVRNTDDQFIGKKPPGANFGVRMRVETNPDETPEEKQLNREILEFLASLEKFKTKPHFSQTNSPKKNERILGNTEKYTPQIV